MYIESANTGYGAAEDFDPADFQGETETDETEEGIGPAAASEAQKTRGADLDVEQVFLADLAQTKRLSREEEIRLMREVVRSRNRIKRILHTAPKLIDGALSRGGRGVIAPDKDFRERETVVVLAYASRALDERAKPAVTGMPLRELKVFVAALSQALDDYRVGRDRMVQANLRLVAMLARRCRHSHLTFLDLIQEGTFGLIRAIEKYQPRRQVKFGTYAVWWIWQHLGRAVDTQGALIRTPVHWNQFRRRMNREGRGAGEEGTGLEGAAVAEGMDPAYAGQMAQSFRYLSTDAPLSSEDSERTLETILAADDVEPETHALHSDLRRRLALVVNELPAREAEILRRRFSLDDSTETLGDIGASFGLSRERIRQLENRALKQLKDLCTERGLQEYLQ